MGITDDHRAASRAHLSARASARATEELRARLLALADVDALGRAAAQVLGDAMLAACADAGDITRHALLAGMRLPTSCLACRIQWLAADALFEGWRGPFGTHADSTTRGLVRAFPRLRREYGPGWRLGESATSPIWAHMIHAAILFEGWGRAEWPLVTATRWHAHRVRIDLEGAPTARELPPDVRRAIDAFARDAARVTPDLVNLDEPEDEHFLSSHRGFGYDGFE